MSKKLQSLSFSRTESPAEINDGKGWTVEDAVVWCQGHDYKSASSGAEDEQDIHFVQFDADTAAPDSFATTTENLPIGVRGLVCDVADVVLATAPPVDADREAMKSFRQPIVKDGKPQEQIKAVAFGVEDEENRIVSFIASDETVDRMGDIIRAGGWKLRDYKKNPVLLWAHNSSEPPIGTVTDIRVEGNRLMARAKFMPAGLHDFADKIWKMVQLGFVRAVSVGFLPKQLEIRRGVDGENLGYEFLEQDLLELSVVPVPANPAALTIARKMGLDTKSMSKIFIPTESSLARVRASQATLGMRLRIAKLGVAGSRPTTHT